MPKLVRETLTKKKKKKKFIIYFYEETFHNDQGIS